MCCVTGNDNRGGTHPAARRARLIIRRRRHAGHTVTALCFAQIHRLDAADALALPQLIYFPLLTAFLHKSTQVAIPQTPGAITA